MVPSRVTGGLTQSSSSSGIYFQGDGQSQSVVNSHLSSSFGNSSNSLSGTTARLNPGTVSGDMNNVALNSVGNSGPSVGASSLVTDANSSLSGGPHLQRSASINTESYVRLPASPLSFSSNNISISGSSIMDGSCVVHQNSHHDQTLQQMQQNQQQGNSSATSMPQGPISNVVLPMVGRIPGSLVQDPNNLYQVQKKPRLDIKQEDILQQQVFQQLLQRPDSMQMQSRNPQLQALLQQQRLRQQQQILQSMPQFQRAQIQQQQQQLQQQQQQMQLRQQMQQQSMQPMNALKRHYDSGVCARRLMQYLYHQRQRPPDNAIAYWRKFVAEYYSPRAKKRWCLSQYDNVGQHALGVFPQAAMDAWQCDICNSKSGRGFESTFEVLPRLNEIKFGSGVLDDLLYLDLPKEYRTPTGIMVLEYDKAVQESVHEQLRVVREGHLRIVFAQDLKILSWEFCARRHEELLPRRLVAPQVNQLVQVAQKCHNTISESGADGISQQDLQANSNMVLTAGHQLAKSLELPSLNDLGFSKRYVRCLQISEVVNSMKDLIDYCRERKTGPIDGLKNYPRHSPAANMQMQQMQQMEQLAKIQGLPTDRTTLNKLMALNPGLTNHPMVTTTNNVMANRGSMSGSALNSYQNIMRQNSMNVSNRAESPSFSNNSNQSPSSPFHGSGPQITQSQLHKLPGSSNGFSSPHLIHQQGAASGGNPGLHNQMIQQLFQEMNHKPGSQQQTFSCQAKNGSGFGSNAAQPSTSNVSGGGVPFPSTSRSNSFKATSSSNNDSAVPASANGFNSQVQEMPQSQSLHHHDELVSDITQEFADGGFFGSDFEDAMAGFNWKT